MHDQSTPRLCRCGCGMPVKPGHVMLSGSHLRKRFTDEQRFWLYVDKGEGPDACWLWAGGRTSRTRNDGRNGYGNIFLNGKQATSHVAAWTMASGEPPTDDFDICHVCDVPICVRNDTPGFYEINGVIRPRWGHLWLGTAADNSADMVAKGRGNIVVDLSTRVRGEENGRAKLTEDDVREIRRLWESNVGHMFTPGRWTMQRLASRYGVNNKTIDAICKRRIWVHVI